MSWMRTLLGGGRKLDLHRKTIEQREREVDRIRKTLDYERQQHKQ